MGADGPKSLDPCATGRKVPTRRACRRLFPPHPRPTELHPVTAINFCAARRSDWRASDRRRLNSPRSGSFELLGLELPRRPREAALHFGMRSRLARSRASVSSPVGVPSRLGRRAGLASSPSRHRLVVRDGFDRRSAPPARGHLRHGRHADRAQPRLRGDVPARGVRDEGHPDRDRGLVRADANARTPSSTRWSPRRWRRCGACPARRP